MSISQSLKSFLADPSKPHALQPIAGERVFVGGAPAGDAGVSLVADRAYLRVRLVGVLLGRSRNWFRDYQPAVHLAARLRFADREASLVRVTAPTREAYARGGALSRNSVLLDLVPFRGGALELEIALLRIKGGDQVGEGVAAVAAASAKVAPPLVGALELAGKVREDAEQLFARGGEVALGCRYQLGANGGGGGALAPGYVAMVRADSGPKDWTLLHVRDEALWWGALEAGRPVVGHEHLLIRIEAVAARDDLHHFRELAELRDRALDAYARGNPGEGAAAYRAAVTAIAGHPELIDRDRRAVIQALRDELARYRAGTSGTPASWEALAGSIRPSADGSPITDEELASWFSAT